MYEAQDRVRGRMVAVKVPAPAFDRDRGFVERFRRGTCAAVHLN